MFSITNLHLQNSSYFGAYRTCSRTAGYHHDADGFYYVLFHYIFFTTFFCFIFTVYTYRRGQLFNVFIVSQVALARLRTDKTKHTNIYIAGLLPTTDDAQLTNMFSKFGTIVQTRILTNMQSSKYYHLF